MSGLDDAIAARFDEAAYLRNLEAEVEVHKEAERIARDKAIYMHRQLAEANATIAALREALTDEDWFAAFLVNHLRGTSRSLAQELIAALNDRLDADPPADNPPEVQTLPHCTGCIEPGSVTHQQETVEHIHDGCGATIAALRDMLERLNRRGGMGLEVHARIESALAHPIPPAAAKLLAERDAGRALFEAVRDEFENGSGAYSSWLIEAAEAYRKVVDG